MESGKPRLKRDRPRQPVLDAGGQLCRSNRGRMWIFTGALRAKRRRVTDIEKVVSLCDSLDDEMQMSSSVPVVGVCGRSAVRRSGSRRSWLSDGDDAASITFSSGFSCPCPCSAIRRCTSGYFWVYLHHFSTKFHLL